MVKFSYSYSAQKIMCTVFWNIYGVLLVDFLTCGEKINSAAYCESLKNCAVQYKTKRRGLLSKDVVLLHDGAHPHTANQTQELIISLSWEQLDHHPHSLDIAPSDYHLHLKTHLAWQ